MPCFVLSTAFHLPLTSLKSRGTSPQKFYILLPLYSAPAKGPESHDLDAIEDELIHEEVQAKSKTYSNKSKQSRRKRQQTFVEKNGSKVYTATVKKNKRRRQRGSKSSTPTSSMPPWLSQYDNDNLMGSYQYVLEDTESLSLTSYADQEEMIDGTQNTLTPMQRLQLAMSGIFYHPNAEPAMLLPNAISYFTPSEINEVIDSIRVASNSNPNLMDGCADFLLLMLTLEEEGMASDFLRSERWDDDDIDDDLDEWIAQSRKTQPHSIMTRDVLIAASFHYCDCVRARKWGVYDYVRQAMGGSVEAPSDQKRLELLLPSASAEENVERIRGSETHNETTQVEFDVDVSLPTKSTSITTIKRRGKSPIERYGDESVNIAAGAARLKRAEIMASVNRRNSNPSHSDAETLRSFLVTLSEDWRGLVIRSAACLYRLKGIEVPESSGKVVLSTTTLRTARDALRVYAPLAQRLGMQRLKSELENSAFRILYRRQHSVASSLYGNDVDEMKAIVPVLTSRIEQLLRSDPIFLDQIDYVSVSSRIKEPYSLWRKMLRIRKQVADAKRIEASTTSDPVSIRWIPDAIALRVVLRASKLSQWEGDDSLRTREKMLCYYALQLISDVWPASTANKAKVSLNVCYANFLRQIFCSNQMTCFCRIISRIQKRTDISPCTTLQI